MRDLLDMEDIDEHKFIIAIYILIDVINSHSKYISITKETHNIVFNNIYDNILNKKDMILARKEINTFLNLDMVFIYGILKDIIDTLYFLHTKYLFDSISWKFNSKTKPEMFKLFVFYADVDIKMIVDDNYDYDMYGLNTKEIDEYDSNIVVCAWLNSINNRIEKSEFLKKYYKFKCDIKGMW